MTTDSGTAEIERILKWAKEHSDALTAELEWQPGGYWRATAPEAKDRVRARAIAALDFLERYSGNQSRWTVSAHEVFENKADNRSMESGARAIGDVLHQWITMVRSGQVTPRLVESFSVRAASSTDLLEQVRALNLNPPKGWGAGVGASTRKAS